MHKCIALFSGLVATSAALGQTTTFDNLNANPLTNKAITWTSSNYGSGFGHRIINEDPGFFTQLNFQGRHNSSSWTNILSLTSDGNVGIGTSSPGSKLTVKGHVNIGDDGNYHLKVRHVDGKNHTDSNIGSLYLNYNTGQKVLVGWGTNASSDLSVAGRLGIGVTSPSHHIDVVNENQPTESFLRFRVKDAMSDYLSIINSTGTSGQFIPLIKGHHVTDNRYSLMLMGQTTESNDTGSNALVSFDARRPDGPILTRPLFVWRSYTTKMMTMLANGNLGIGTTNPGTYKLAVKGKIRAEEIKVETGWADYVFEEGYDLPTLEQVENHIKKKGHLINIPSAKEVEANGIELGEMNKLLLEKIEELTLYILQQQKEIQQLKMQQKSMMEHMNKSIANKSISKLTFKNVQQ